MPNSLFAVCLQCQGEMIGTGRVVGDGALVFYVQDLMVLPKYQRRGYGRMMMDALMAFVTAHAAPMACIALFSAKGMERFYAEYGFVERPTDHLGPGMAFFRK